MQKVKLEKDIIILLELRPEDQHLPKYISATREKGIIIGYKIGSYPIGIDSKKRINRSFQNVENPQIAYERAIACLNKLNIKYADLQKQIQESREKDIKENIKNKEKKKLPDFVEPILKDKCIIGYSVIGVKDSNNNDYPTKDFIGKHGNYNTLLDAHRYIRDLKIKTSNDLFIENGNIFEEYEEQYDKQENNIVYNKNSICPRYIWTCRKNGIRTGYKVMVIRKEKSYYKAYTSHCQSLEEKFNKATEYLKNLYETVLLK